MTLAEFTQWLSWYFRCWPDFGQWFGKLPHESRQTLITEWYAILSTFSVRDLNAACQAQLSGLADVAPAYQRSLIAAHLREAAAQIRQQRNEKDNARKFTEEKLQYERPEILNSSWAAVTEINQRVVAGEDREAVTREIVQAVKRGER